jgi:hypothetical protein
VKLPGECSVVKFREHLIQAHSRVRFSRHINPFDVYALAWKMVPTRAHHFLYTFKSGYTKIWMAIKGKWGETYYTGNTAPRVGIREAFINFPFTIGFLSGNWQTTFQKSNLKKNPGVPPYPYMTHQPYLAGVRSLRNNRFLGGVQIIKKKKKTNFWL